MAFLVLVAIAGLALIPILAFQPAISYFEASMRQALVGSLYIAICVLGTVAVFYPKGCRNILRKSQNPLPQTKKPSISIRGHHPDCIHYSANRIKFGGRSVCAACSGLLAGAAIALAGATMYFFAGKNVGGGGIWLLVLGICLMLLGLAQIKFGGYSKVVANLFFVVGSLLIVVETDIVGGNALVDFYALGVVAFLLWLRILVSEWNNNQICLKCKSCGQ